MGCTYAEKYVVNGYGYTAKNPCGYFGAESWGWVQACGYQLAESWHIARQQLVKDVVSKFRSLQQLEKGMGISTKTDEFTPRMGSLAGEEALAARPEDTYSNIRPWKNHLDIQKSIAIMQTASCLMQDIDAAFRKYNKKTPGSSAFTTENTPTPPAEGLDPTDRPSSTYGRPRRPKPPKKTFAEQVGEGTLTLLGVGLLGFAAYMYIQSRKGGRASTTKFLAVPGSK